MNSGSFTYQSFGFRDFRESERRSQFLLLDHQKRNTSSGFQSFQENGDTAKLVNGLLGWNKTAIESMALYQARVAAKPEPEARVWMIEGISGGLGPGWDMVGGFYDDRRLYPPPQPVLQLRKKNKHNFKNSRP